MENRKVVVALGRNAFSESFPKQQERVKLAAKAIADLVEEKYEVIITHSNGPQVGMIQTAMTEYSRLDPDRTVAPMSICCAMSQGYIGFDLKQLLLIFYSCQLLILFSIMFNYKYIGKHCQIFIILLFLGFFHNLSLY